MQGFSYGCFHFKYFPIDFSFYFGLLPFARIKKKILDRIDFICRSTVKYRHFIFSPFPITKAMGDTNIRKLCHLYVSVQLRLISTPIYACTRCTLTKPTFTYTKAFPSCSLKLNVDGNTGCRNLNRCLLDSSVLYPSAHDLKINQSLPAFKAIIHRCFLL